MTLGRLSCRQKPADGQDGDEPSGRSPDRPTVAPERAFESSSSRARSGERVAPPSFSDASISASRSNEMRIDIPPSSVQLVTVKYLVRSDSGRKVVLAVLSWSVVGCGWGYTVEQNPRQLTVEGTLDGGRVDGFDCVWLVRPTGAHIDVKYPDGWESISNPTRLTDPSGAVVAGSGDRVRVTGPEGIGESVCAPEVFVAETVQVLDYATPTTSPATSTLALPSSAPSLSPPPSDLPSMSPAPLGSVRIPFANREMVVTIGGEPGTVVAWRAATRRELESIAWDGDADITLGRLSGRDLILGWVGTVCDLEATLTIAPGRLTVTPAPRQGCDAMALGRGMVLTFADRTDPKDITIELGETVLLPEGG